MSNFNKGERVRFWSYFRQAYIQGRVVVSDGQRTIVAWENVDWKGHNFESWVLTHRLEGLELKHQKEV